MFRDGETMQLRTIRGHLLLGLQLLLLGTAKDYATEITGYVPDYRMNGTYLTSTLPGQLPLVDEVRYFGMTVASDGSITSNTTHLANLAALRGAVQALPLSERPRIVLTLGGAGMSDQFASVSADAIKRTTLANQVASFLSAQQLDGVDFDWEHPDTLPQRANYETLLKQVKGTVGTRRVTTTVAPSILLTNDVVSGTNAIDGIDVMTYDLGWWSTDPSDPLLGEHSPPIYVTDSVNAWTNTAGASIPRNWVFGSQPSPGIAHEKLGIGLPFYGRGYDGTSFDVALSYAALRSQGTTTDGRHYEVGANDLWIPSLQDVSDRLAYAQQRGLRNIIIWELGHDLPASNPQSMLARLIHGDFDRDGDYDCSDVDDLVAHIVAASTSQRFDLNRDGLVNGSDLTRWLAEGGAAELASGTPFVLGDFNLDGFVDGSDFNIWNSHKFTVGATWCSGDANADGFIDGSDFNIWNSHKFQSSDSGSAVVPEPESIAWIILLVAPFVMMRLMKDCSRSEQRPCVGSSDCSRSEQRH